MQASKLVSISEIDELKLIYFEIIEGASFDFETGLYIKHFSDVENHAILRKRIDLFRYYSQEGVPHETDLLKTAIDNEEWSQQKEDHILELKYLISDNEKNIHNIIPEQRAGIDEIIKQKKKELSKAIYEKKCVLGRSVEDLVDEDVNDFVVYLSFYQDKNLLKPIEPNYDDFQNDDIRINKLNIVLSFHYQKFSEDKIKGVACLPMFLNRLSYCKEDSASFLGKPMANLTHNQSYLLSFALRNLNTATYSKGHPPNLNLEAKIIDLIKWYDIQHSILISKKNE